MAKMLLWLIFIRLTVYVFQCLRLRDIDIFGLFYGYGLTPRARYIVAPVSRKILAHVCVL